jgi:glucose/mannose-6-phosphate isomerase
VAEKQWQQLAQDFQVDLPNWEGITNIVVGGMGGSAWPALYLKSWPGTKVPLEVISNYNLPAYVNESTLFISSSYSGNTEETLSALAEAESKGAHLVVMTAGGKLADIARQKNLPLYLIPGGIQPRMSSFYFLAALIQILEPLGLVGSGSLEELRGVADWVKQCPDNWRADIPTERNPAKQLVLELIGKSIVVYSGPKLYPAANKFKICLNENAKNIAWVNYYPEFNHNEFIGWSSHPIDKPYAVVEYRSNLEHERVQKRFVVSERLLSGKRPAPEVVVPEGNSLLKQLLWTSVFSDFVSLYVALLNGLNPTPVDLVEEFKRQLDS